MQTTELLLAATQAQAATRQVFEPFTHEQAARFRQGGRRLRRRPTGRRSPLRLPFRGATRLARRLTGAAARPAAVRPA